MKTITKMKTTTKYYFTKPQSIISQKTPKAGISQNISAASWLVLLALALAVPSSISAENLFRFTDINDSVMKSLTPDARDNVIARNDGVKQRRRTDDVMPSWFDELTSWRRHRSHRRHRRTSTNDENSILDSLNDMRRAVGASNMQYVMWDSQLESFSTLWATQCQILSRVPRTNFFNQSNVFFYNASMVGIPIATNQIFANYPSLFLYANLDAIGCGYKKCKIFQDASGNTSANISLYSCIVGFLEPPVPANITGPRCSNCPSSYIFCNRGLCSNTYPMQPLGTLQSSPISTPLHAQYTITASATTASATTTATVTCMTTAPPSVSHPYRIVVIVLCILFFIVIVVVFLTCYMCMLNRRGSRRLQCCIVCCRRGRPSEDLTTPNSVTDSAISSNNIYVEPMPFASFPRDSSPPAYGVVLGNSPSPPPYSEIASVPPYSAVYYDPGKDYSVEIVVTEGGCDGGTAPCCSSAQTISSARVCDNSLPVYSSVDPPLHTGLTSPVHPGGVTSPVHLDGDYSPVNPGAGSEMSQRTRDNDRVVEDEGTNDSDNTRTVTRSSGQDDDDVTAYDNVAFE